MERRCPDPLHRTRAGFAVAKLLILILLVFGVYTGCQFMPAYVSSRRVQSAVDGALAEATLRTRDDVIRGSILKKARSTAVTLEPEDILIERERGEGERIIYVDIEYPHTVSYLGSERTLYRYVEGVRVFEVDEAAEARRAEREQRKAAEQRKRERAAERRTAKFRDAMDECEEKHGKGNCTTFYLPGDGSDDILKLY